MNPQDNEQTELLREILKWIKFTGMKEVKSILTSVLDNDLKKIAYQRSDGTRGSVEIARIVGLGSNRTVANWWESWLKLSIGESVPAMGGRRFKRSFDLADFNIDVPEPKENLRQKKAVVESSTNIKADTIKQSSEDSHA
jgi:hypothetical protein